MAAHFVLCFFLSVTFYCSELHQGLRVSFRETKTSLGPQYFFLPTVPRQFFCCSSSFFVCAFAVSYLAYMLSLSVPHLLFPWYIGRAVLRNCGIHLYFYKASNPLRKHAYSTILKILPPKIENFQIKIF